jgi:putative endonuclease
MNFTPKIYYVYILKCSDDSYYTGVTNNLERRLNEHQYGVNEGSYTYFRRPVELKFFEEFKYINQAIEVEKKIKKWSKGKKKALIENNWDKIKELSICKNSSNSKNYKN